MMERWPLRVFIVTALASVGLAGSLAPTVRSAGPRNVDMLTQILGGTSQLAADRAYQRANIYLHGGVDCGHSCADYIARQACKHVVSELPLIHLVHALQETTVPKEHRHLASEEERELLPWFLAAVRLNPHHVEAWCVGTYWFYRTKQYKHAEELITSGIQHNPRDYRLYIERGILFFRLKRWERALKDLERAKALLPTDCSESDSRTIHRYLGYIQIKSADAGAPR